MDYHQLAKNMPLLAAIQDGNVDGVQVAFDNGAEVNYQITFDECKTPLHHAVAVGDTGIVELLLKKGADPEARSKDGKKPLDMLSNPACKSEIEGIFQKYGCVIPPISPSSAASLPVSTYTKRKGTSSGIRGQLYETKLLALVLFRALHRAAITAFSLATNVDDAGAFDDVVLRYTEDGTDKALYLQAKHKDGKRTNLRDMLDGKADKGDFSMRKYFKSFLDMKIAAGENASIPEDVEFIIFTNIGVDCSLPGDTNVKVKYAEADSNHLFFTSCKGNSIQLIGSLQALKETALEWYYESLADIFAEQFICSKESVEVREFIISSLNSVDSAKSSLELVLSSNLNRATSRKNESNKIKSEIMKLLQSGTLPRAKLSEEDYGSLVGDFFNKLHLFTSQANEREVEDLLKAEISRHYPRSDDLDILFQLYHSAVQQWWLQTGQVPYQTKESTLFATARSALQRNTWLKNLQDISMNKLLMCNVEFCVDKIENAFKEQIEHFMERGSEVLYVVCNNSTVSLLKLVHYLQFKSYDFSYIDSDVLKLTKFCDKLETSLSCVVFISERKKDKEIVKKLQKYARRIIIISEESPKRKLNTLNDSNKGLVDLTTKCQEDFLNREVLFQGMAVSLRSLIDDRTDLIDEQSLYDLMIKDTIEVAPVCKSTYDNDVMNYYVERKISRCLLRNEILDDKSFIFISHWEAPAFSNNGQDIIIIFSELHNPNDDTLKFLNFNAAQTYFDHICRKYPQRNVHLLREVHPYMLNYFFLFDNLQSKLLQWEKSQNSIENILAYASASNANFATEPSTLSDIDQSLVLLAAEPGMGKSSFLTALAHKIKLNDPSVWIVRIDLLDFSGKFSEWQQNGVKLTEAGAFAFLESAIFGQSAHAETSFGKAIFHEQCKLKKPVILLDGFDEICPDYEETVLSLVNILRQEFISKLWITTRSGVIQKQLELLFNQFAFTLRPFQKTDCTEFLFKYWQARLSVDALNESNLTLFADDFYRKLEITEIRDNDSMRVPLHMKMIATIYEPNCHNFLLNPSENDEFCIERFDLITLYEKIVEMAFLRLHKEKHKTDVAKPSVKRILERDFKLNYRRYQILAVRSIFNASDLRWFLTNDECSSIDSILQDEKFHDNIGIIRSITDNIPVFVHRTYAEFFCALFIFEKYATLEFKHKSNAFTKFINNLLTKMGSWYNRSQLVTFLKIIVEKRKNDIKSKKFKLKFLMELVLSSYDDIYNDSIFVLFICLTENSIDENDSVPYLSRLIKHASVNNKKKLFRTACEAGCIKIFRMCVPFAEIKNNGVYFLREAAFEGHVKIVALLLKYNVTDNDPSYIRYFIKHVSSNSWLQTSGCTALHVSSEKGHIEVVELLLANGANVNVPSLQGYTPLMKAVKYRHLDVVKLLLKNGADTNICSIDNGNSPLLIASTCGYYEIVQLLLTHGAQVNTSTINEGFTPLMQSSLLGHKDVVELLLDNGADVNSVSTYDAATALFMAAQNGHPEVVSLLLARGSKVDVRRSIDGFTPLMQAAFFGHKEVVHILLQNGANCNKWSTNEGFTPLHMVARNGHDEIVRLLIENGAKVNTATANNGITPLHYAANNGHITVVKTLVENGAEINCIDRIGCTPADRASISGYSVIVDFLLEKGAHFDNLTLIFLYLTLPDQIIDCGYRNVATKCQSKVLRP